MKAILWDNDGVLVDTERFYFDASREALARLGVVFDEATYVDHCLRRGASCFDLLRSRGVGEDAIALARAGRDARYEELISEVELIPGVHETLESLHGRVPMAVVTSSQPHHFDRQHARTGARRFFDFVLTAADYARHKPDPEPYLLAAARLGIAPEDCLVRRGHRARARGCHSSGHALRGDSALALRRAAISPRPGACFPKCAEFRSSSPTGSICDTGGTRVLRRSRSRVHAARRRFARHGDRGFLPRLRGPRRPRAHEAAADRRGAAGRDELHRRAAREAQGPGVPRARRGGAHDAQELVGDGLVPEGGPAARARPARLRESARVQHVREQQAGGARARRRRRPVLRRGARPQPRARGLLRRRPAPARDRLRAPARLRARAGRWPRSHSRSAARRS